MELTYKYPSLDGSSTVYSHVWTDSDFTRTGHEGTKDPVAVIQLVHGMAEHVGRYDRYARWLVEEGFVVVADDHIGHGLSAEDAVDLGHMPPHSGKEILLADENELSREVREAYPDVPFVLYGHSLGSYISRAYIARRGRELDAVVLQGTGHVPPALTDIGRGLALTLGTARGMRTLSPLLDKLSTGPFTKPGEAPGAWLSNNPDNVQAFLDDPLCGFIYSYGGYATIFDIIREVCDPGWAKRVPKDLPVYLVSGAQDPVGDDGRGVAITADALRNAGVETVDMKLYEGMRHEIHNERDGRRVAKETGDWIKGHVTGR